MPRSKSALPVVGEDGKLIIDPRDLERFWSRVEKKGEQDCWDWNGKRMPHGYGLFFLYEKTVLTHRLSYRLHIGEIPEGFGTLHRCDRPCCVNPAHLFLGTQDDNMKDCARKGRTVKQETSWLFKHPERRFWGDKNPSRIYPERLKRGDDHWTRSHPGRQKGEKNHGAKLTDEKVRKIRELKQTTKLSQQAIGKIVGISQMVVCDVLRGKLWGHVK